MQPEYVGGPQISGPEKVRGCSPLARSEPILVGLLARVGFCFVPESAYVRQLPDYGVIKEDVDL